MPSAYRHSEHFLTKAEQVVRRVAHPSDDIRQHRLEDAEHRWFYTMFLQVLGKYLRSQGRAGRTRFSVCLRAADLAALRPLDGRPTRTPWLSRSRRSSNFRPRRGRPRTSGRAISSQFAAIHADAAERPAFEALAVNAHREAVRTLQEKSTLALARPVIVLLGSGAVPAWLSAHPMATAPNPAASGPLPPPIAFVPQRLRAERRAKALAAIGGVALVWLAWLVLF